jgi:hypothetical protein
LIIKGLAVVLFLTGCASMIMQRSVGKDVGEVMLDYGAPANALDMGDGRRAFQWIIGSTYTMPTYATTTGTVSTVGYHTWVTSNTAIHGGQTVSSQCVYTLFAKWDGAASGWHVVDFRKPNILCE